MMGSIDGRPIILYPTAAPKSPTLDSVQTATFVCFSKPDFETAEEWAAWRDEYYGECPGLYLNVPFGYWELRPWGGYTTIAPWGFNANGHAKLHPDDEDKPEVYERYREALWKEMVGDDDY